MPLRQSFEAEQLPVRIRLHSSWRHWFQASNGCRLVNHWDLKITLPFYILISFFVDLRMWFSSAISNWMEWAWMRSRWDFFVFLGSKPWPWWSIDLWICTNPARTDGVGLGYGHLQPKFEKKLATIFLKLGLIFTFWFFTVKCPKNGWSINILCVQPIFVGFLSDFFGFLVLVFEADQNRPGFAWLPSSEAAQALCAMGQLTYQLRGAAAQRTSWFNSMNGLFV